MSESLDVVVGNESLAELDMRLERFVEESVLKAFPDSLLDNGSQVYIRRVGGRLQWIRANVYGGGEKWQWQELTPVTAKHLELVGTPPETLAAPTESESLEELRRKLLGEEPRDSGWYQDSSGQLYEYSGGRWVGRAPAKNVLAKLEFLG